MRLRFITLFYWTVISLLITFIISFIFNALMNLISSISHQSEILTTDHFMNLFDFTIFLFPAFLLFGVTISFKLYKNIDVKKGVKNERRN